MQFAFLNSKKYAAINAAKTVIACLIAYALGRLLDSFFRAEQMYMWMVITVLVVMSTQPNLGGALDKALMRFVGTIISASIAIVIILISFNKVEAFSLAFIFIMVAVFIAGASSKFSYAGSLAGITMIIIILNENVSVELAVFRMIEISQGIVIALLVNRFVFPIRAERRLKESFSKTISDIKTFYGILFHERGSIHEDLMTNIFSEFTKQINLIKEVSYENKTQVVKEYQKMSLYIRRLYRYMILIYDYVDTSIAEDDKESLLKDITFIDIEEKTLQILGHVSKSIEKNKQVDYKEILAFEAYVKNNFENIVLLNGYGNQILEFYIKTFLKALEELAVEHNYIASH
ncbi:FUSC family protein [Francisella frigiditurris]|uniref:Aluminum activated malate transporter family protein n=1 Tax=Francisella frigiditurris TaxID=1542390 RepID=A0A1J0KUC0_9GAMM|nr:FUSC family protein [Francisella frigiditurris]APC97345.1 aluminum activated malate transporter family protein [Francisella frigiditurris]